MQVCLVSLTATSSEIALAFRSESGRWHNHFPNEELLVSLTLSLIQLLWVEATID